MSYDGYCGTQTGGGWGWQWGNSDNSDYTTRAKTNCPKSHPLVSCWKGEDTYCFCSVRKRDCTDVKGEGDYTTSKIEKIYTLNGACGLEWHGDKGEGPGVGGNQRLAKWDCKGYADPVFRNGNKICAMAEGEKCCLAWGQTWWRFYQSNALVAKWDCSSGGGDPVRIEDDGRIYSKDNCGLQWVSGYGGDFIGDDDKYAKWVCGANGDSISWN